MVPDSEDILLFRPSGCSVVCLPAGGAAAPLSATGGCVLQAVVSVFAVGSSGRRTPGIEVPLALALTDSLLLCVLQEPLEDPSAVAHTLEKVNFGSEVILEEALVQVQTDFESSVKDLLQGLDGLWTQLEELHAGVTLTKKDSQGNKDLASAQADAEPFALLPQDLTWSHTHISSKVNSGSESVWPDLLLQFNIEQVP
ncbi:hypothetical protein XENOCAPTIV_017329 [Xenoophorus captivus]|uniref:Uncharacterized protein n=1 Tax=Xenoophorus captivus TaxID=1517983 RepID=A0ABV0RWF9_9TELE